MEAKDKQKILAIIRDAIDEVVYSEYKQFPKKMQAKKEELTKTAAQREQEVHDALFGKKEEDFVNRLKIYESEEKPRVTPNELLDFEKEFKSRFPNIIFEKQNKIGQNGEIVDFPIVNEQKDAFTSGKITSENESIRFSMSLIDGFKIYSIIENNQAIPFEINSDTKDIFNKLLNLYEEIFKKKFNEIINPISQQNDMTGDISTTPTASPTTGNSAEQTMGTAPVTTPTTTAAQV